MKMLRFILSVCVWSLPAVFVCLTALRQPCLAIPEKTLLPAELTALEWAHRDPIPGVRKEAERLFDDRYGLRVVPAPGVQLPAWVQPGPPRPVGARGQLCSEK